jgi:hypothetical protein
VSGEDGEVRNSWHGIGLRVLWIRGLVEFFDDGKEEGRIAIELVLSCWWGFSACGRSPEPTGSLEALIFPVDAGLSPSDHSLI